MRIPKALITVISALSVSLSFMSGAAHAAVQFLQVSTTYPQVIVDSAGHWVRFRGVDYNLIHHTSVNAPTQADVDTISGLGPFHIIRLPINWNFLEPTPGNIDFNYVNSIISAVQMAANDNMYVLIDMSHWNTSQCFTQLYGNGFPGWVVDDMLNYEWGHPNCASYDDSKADDQTGINLFWTEFYSNPTVPASAAINAGQGNTVWDAYSYAYRVVAWQLRNYPNVLGWDMINEPQQGNMNYDNLASNILPSFYNYVGARIRWSDTADQYGNQHHILFFEGVGGGINPHLGMPNLSNLVLAPHDYLPQNEWGSCADAQTLAHDGLDWAANHNVPVLVGEFGAYSDTFDGDSNGPVFAYNMSHIISVNGQSWIWWVYDPTYAQQPTNSLVDPNGKPYAAVGQLQKNINVYSGAECPS